MFKGKLKKLILEEISERVKRNMPGMPEDLYRVTTESLVDAITDSVKESVEFATKPEVLISALSLAAGLIPKEACSCKDCIKEARKEVERSFKDMTRSKN